jgi:hypothetical protein
MNRSYMAVVQVDQPTREYTHDFKFVAPDGR